MHLGGAEISLIGLLQALDPKKVDIDLFVYSHEGELMKLIPGYVNLLPENKAYSMFERPMVEVLKKGHWGVLVARLWSKFKTKQYIKYTQPAKACAAGMGYLGKYVSKVVPDINPNVEYDLAISFLTPHNFVRDHVCAKKKICWIHTDYSRIDINAELELPVWDSFDHIISISSDVTETFLKTFPSLASKIVVLENILSSDFVRHRADEFIVKWDNEKVTRNSVISHDLKSNYLRLLSIGRFCEAKNYDNVPDICRRMLQILNTSTSSAQDPGQNENIHPDGSLTSHLSPLTFDIKWYIIGFGGDEALIRQKIEEAGMQEHVIILGKKENPYPYIKACDIYVQPSRYEGKSVTVREAQMLCKPVVVTNYPTASSQIQDGIDGAIVPMDNEGCAKGLAEFIINTDKQNCIVEYLKSHDYGNVEEVEKIYNILNVNINDNENDNEK